MGTRARLSAMMALAYAVQGAWWPLLAVHLGDLGIRERDRGWIFATLAFAAIVSPPIAGPLADRTIAAQRLLAIVYGCGAVLLGVMASGVATTYRGLFPLFLAYWLVMIPYLGLTNAVAMRNLGKAREEFGSIRLWGTIGWMAVGWVVSALMAAGGLDTHAALWVGCALSALMALFALTLPDTPPLASGAKGLPLREAAALLRRPGVAALLASGFLVSLTTPFVYQAVPPYLRHVGLPRSRVAAAMSLGQPPEILALSVLPLVLLRFGRKRTMAAGIASWVAYHGLLALTPGIGFALAVVMLNGLAIAFFHVAAPIYLDAQAPPDRRAGAQGLWVMATSGFGSLAGGLLAGEVMQGAAGDWRLVFAVPATIAAAALALFLAAFRSVPRRDPIPPAGRGGRVGSVAEAAR